MTGIREKVDAKAKVEGARYSEDKPRACTSCYWWQGGKRGCSLPVCHYILPAEEKKPKTVKGSCEGCPYGKHRICIGYCIAKIEREVRGRTNPGWPVQIPEAF